MKEYFSHDYYAREDEKIKNLLFAHKWDGYGIYWALVEMLYQNNGYMQLHYNRIAFELRTDENIIDSIINDFGLFKIKGEKFTSDSILRRLKIREDKSEIYKSNALKRWKPEIKDDAIALQQESNSNAIKVNKIKEKKSIEEIQSIFLEEVKTFRGEYVDELLDAFYNHWSEPNTSKTKMRKDLEKTWDTSRRLITWHRNSLRFKK